MQRCFITGGAVIGFAETGGGGQCLSQDLETGSLKLAIVKFWGVQIFKGITIY